MGTISTMLDSIPGVKQDWKEDWKEDAKADWKVDWDDLAGDIPASAPVNTVLPVITGTPVVGATLTVNTGTWSGFPAPTFTYQWLVDGDEIAATTSSYVVQQSAVGDTVSVEVTATNVAGSATVETVAVGPVTEPELP